MYSSPSPPEDVEVRRYLTALQVLRISEEGRLAREAETVEVVSCTISKLPTGKATGSDGFPADYRAFFPIIAQKLFETYVEAKGKGVLPPTMRGIYSLY